MRALVITDAVRTKIQELCAVAAASPVNMTLLVSALAEDEGKRRHMAQMTGQTISIPFGFQATFSIELGHPIGTCRHLSVSVDETGMIPYPVAVWMIAREFGFWGHLSLCSIWEETLQGHGRAVNVVQPILEENE